MDRPDAEDECAGEPQGREQADAGALEAAHPVLGLTYQGAKNKR
jgi:hypothetical protein